MTSSPLYDIIEQTINKETVYDHELFKSLKSNPTYGVIQECNKLGNNSEATQSGYNDAIQPNPSCSANSKSSRVIYEDLDGYVKTDFNNL